MQDILRLIFVHVAGIWRHRWYALAVALVACPIGWFYTASLPDEYVAQARVFVDTDSVLTPLLSGLALQTNDDRRVVMMTNVLFSRENMEKLARMTDMDLRAKTPQQMDTLVADLKGRVRLSRQGENIYIIAFEDRSPELAKRVVQSMLTIFVESNLGSSRQDQDSAERFLQREVKDYERRLIEGERKLKDFKMRNLDLLSDRGSYYTRLQAARATLKKAEEGVKTAQRRRDQLEDQIAIAEEQGAESADYAAYVEDNLKDALAEPDRRIAEVQRQLDEMLMRYTEIHPDIVALKAAMGRLKTQREAAKKEFLAKQDQSAVVKSLSGNPLYQQLRVRLSEAESDIAEQQSRAESLKGEIEKNQASVDQVLQVEAEQQQLNRDYEILKSNHRQLLERIEKARLTREVDTSVDTVKFRTLDPPKVPERPSDPNRVLFASMVFGGSLAGGLGLALLLSLMRPVFGDRRQLSEVTGLPVLGSVNMVWTSVQRRKKRWGNVAFGVTFFGLIGAFAGVLTVFIMQIDVMSMLPIQ
jgi:polysaccharide chain length determinant protein (PEP-CTERM system associated)